MKPNEEDTQAFKSSSLTLTQMHLSDNFYVVHDHLKSMRQIVFETDVQVHVMSMKILSIIPPRN